MSCTPGDITIKRGNDAPAIAWRMKQSDGTLCNLTGSEFVLTIFMPRRRRDQFLIRKITGVDASLVVDIDAGTVTWTPTIEESRSIPRGRLALYELEQRQGGTQRTLIRAAVIGEGGDNDDD